MNSQLGPVIIGLLLPLLGTTLGAAMVFFLKKELNSGLQKALTGFAAGVMVAASIWSLLIPAMEESASMGKLAFLPAVVGFWIGVLFLLLLDHVVPHLHVGEEEAEGPKVGLKKTTMMVLAVTLHNIPEGMAVGVVFAGWLAAEQSTGGAAVSAITIGGAIAMSLGIAIQNFPEGAIVSLPLRMQGESKGKAFRHGFISGAVEPIAALITVLASRAFVPILPYLLSFAAGAMMFVVVEELIPEMSEGEHSHVDVLFFAVGFTLMMVLDVALG